MSISNQISTLITKTRGLKLLYVEDDIKLQERTLKFLNKIFPTILIASNGKEGLSIYENEHIDIVITDIKMPIMDGLELSKKLKEINPKVQIIITSAYDDKTFLLDAIKVGIAQYLIKPIKIEEFLNVLEKSIDTILIEKRIEAMQKLDNIFSHERNLLTLIDKEEVKICNKSFLKFFNVKNLSEFNKKYNFSQEVKLLNSKEIDTIEYITTNLDKIFQVEMKNFKNQQEKFLLILNQLPYAKNEYTALFIDITNMQSFENIHFKEDSVNSTKNKIENSEILEIFENIKNSSENIKFYNLYKGLSIFHNGKIVDIYRDNIEVEVDEFQLFAFNHEQQTFLHSENFKNDILAEVKEVNIENKRATLTNFYYLETSPRFRKSPRIEVENRLMITVESSDFFLVGEIKDISKDSISFKTKELPPKVNLDVEVTARFNLNINGQKVEINTKGIIFKISKENNIYIITLLLTNHKLVEKEMLEYISERQINLIKEFKSKSL